MWLKFKYRLLFRAINLAYAQASTDPPATTTTTVAQSADEPQFERNPIFQISHVILPPENIVAGGFELDPGLAYVTWQGQALNSTSYRVKIYRQNRHALVAQQVTVANIVFFENLTPGVRYHATVTTLVRSPSGAELVGRESRRVNFILKGNPTECTSPQVYSERCDAHCVRTCVSPIPACDRSCRPGCACPRSNPIWHDNDCIKLKECPPHEVTVVTRKPSGLLVQFHEAGSMLKWDRVVGASRYKVTVRLNRDRSVVAQQQDVDIPLAFLPNLTPGTEYFFAVAAIFPYSAEGLDSIEVENIAFVNITQNGFSVTWDETSDDFYDVGLFGFGGSSLLYDMLNFEKASVQFEELPSDTTFYVSVVKSEIPRTRPPHYTNLHEVRTLVGGASADYFYGATIVAEFIQTTTEPMATPPMPTTTLGMVADQTERNPSTTPQTTTTTIHNTVYPEPYPEPTAGPSTTYPKPEPTVSNQDTSASLTTCQQQYQSALRLREDFPDIYIQLPQCDIHGAFLTTACRNFEVCWCVNPLTGEQVMGTEFSTGGVLSLNCDRVGQLAGPPTMLSASEIGSTSATLMWESNSERAGYIGDIFQGTTHIRSVHSTSQSTMRIQNLQPETEYMVWVSGVSEIGWTTVKTEVVFTTAGLSAPEDVFVVQNQNNSLTVQWASNSEGILHNLQLLNTTSQVVLRQVTTDAGTNQYTFYGLQKFHSYTVKIRAAVESSNGTMLSSPVEVSATVLCTLRPVDIIFLFDISSNGQNGKLEKAKELAVNVIRALSPPSQREQTTRVSAIKYTRWTRFVFPFDRYNNTEDAVTKLLELQSSNNPVLNTGHMLKVVHRELYGRTTRIGYRPRENALSVIVHFAGRRSMGPVTRPASWLKQSANGVIAIGVEGHSYPPELNEIATSEDSKLTSPSYNALPSLLTSVLRAICKFQTM
uniref:uncharacterized protein LOC100181240 isoform X2 n=1 Tax=Ciona intestinalis TaxID=7719 RepID=UPI000EF529A2|nr:uncharacterized protein LOC100181240 isoform X2 [Ciona intestinalis]|eukprot:XP_026693584.1 uncharacterized protein LOC100181240 isoform X2 [Ciona intestinalis]